MFPYVLSFKVFELPTAPWRDAQVSTALAALLDVWTLTAPSEKHSTTEEHSTIEKHSKTEKNSTADPCNKSHGNKSHGKSDTVQTQSYGGRQSQRHEQSLLGSERGTDVTSLVKRVRTGSILFVRFYFYSC